MLFVVRPIARARARELCQKHPHAGTLPNSSKFCFELFVDGKSAGLAVWGYGIVPQATPKKLFGEAGHKADYLELCRFFVHDFAPPNSASKFLSITHKLFKKHTRIKWLYTYAAGFQGMHGCIYQAAGYEYIGLVFCPASFIYIPGVGLVHTIAQWHRYKKHGVKNLSPIFPDCKQWVGANFRYIYWLCGKSEKRRLMQFARFKVMPYPKKEDIEIWTVDKDGNKQPVSAEFAKTVPIVKLKSRRVRSDTSDTPGHQPGEGGAAPTLTLQSPAVAG